MRKKLLGLGILLGVFSAHGMEPAQDMYARILSPQNRCYLESLGYSEQDIANAVFAERFAECERTKPILTFFEQEKACPTDLAVQDSRMRSGLRVSRAEGDRIANITQLEDEKLQSLKKWDKRKLVTIPITLLITSPIAIWLMASFFSCKPHAS